MAYADVCFREFGDRVSHWTPLVEPNVNAMASYDSGAFPPNHCSYPFGLNCTVGNSTVEPYIVGHNSLLAHASVVRLYREKYQVIEFIYFVALFKFVPCNVSYCLQLVTGCAKWSYRRKCIHLLVLSIFELRCRYCSNSKIYGLYGGLVSIFPIQNTVISTKSDCSNMTVTYHSIV